MIEACQARQWDRALARTNACPMAEPLIRRAVNAKAHTPASIRFNVTTSRARGAVIVVASPQLFAAECRTPAQMRMVNGALSVQGAGAGGVTCQ